MRHILTIALFATMPFAASADCSDYPNWIEAQRAYRKGEIALDGAGPGEPDGLACESNPGFPGELGAREMIGQGLPEWMPEGPAAFPLNTWSTDGLGVAPRTGGRGMRWSGSCPGYRYSTPRSACP